MDQLLIALDVESGERGLQLSSELRGICGRLQDRQPAVHPRGPFARPRPDDRGVRVFLDLKFHDIPNTVAQAVESAVLTGAWMINVHASGGLADDAGGGASRTGRPRRARAVPPRSSSE